MLSSGLYMTYYEMILLLKYGFRTLAGSCSRLHQFGMILHFPYSLILMLKNSYDVIQIIFFGIQLSCNLWW